MSKLFLRVMALLLLCVSCGEFVAQKTHSPIATSAWQEYTDSNYARFPYVSRSRTYTNTTLVTLGVTEIVSGGIYNYTWQLYPTRKDLQIFEGFLYYNPTVFLENSISLLSVCDYQIRRYDPGVIFIEYYCQNGTFGTPFSIADFSFTATSAISGNVWFTSYAFVGTSGGYGFNPDVIDLPVSVR